MIDTAKYQVINHKGLLTMDENYPTCNKRFVELGFPNVVE